MKHWWETAQLYGRIARLAASDRRAALATVVRIHGSAYRRPGAKLLIEDDGRMIGGVSGGCLEADVREVGLATLRSETSRLLHYDTGADEDAVWGLGLGCNGAVDVFVQPANAAFLRAVVEPTLARLHADQRFAIVTTVEGLDAGKASVRDVRADEAASHLDDTSAGRTFTEILEPPPRLVICGGGADAVPLVRFAGDCGFRVTLVDHREAYLAPEGLPDGTRCVLRRPESGIDGLPGSATTYVVVKMHALTHDEAWARAFLGTEVAYIGLLGPRDRTDRIISRIGTPDARVFGPVGLDLGADGPEQIAASIVAELLAVHAGRTPAHLRDRARAIHAG
ncbi:MAG TPA: XdhC family protein [Gemmatimonadales bacterium]|nr:XdhC family protein [Gemmatimonadales bacterium]